MAVNIQYKAKISAKWILGKDEYNIETNSISSVLIEHDYDNNNLPLIYLIVNLKSSIYNQMVNNSENKKSKIYLEIKNYNMNEDNPIGIVDIKNQFTYFMPKNQNYEQDIIDEASKNNNDESAYIRVAIGLMNQSMLDKNRKNFEDKIFDGINKPTLVYRALKHYKKLCINNISATKLPVTIMPPMSTVSEYLEYVDDLYDIYKYGYRFFNDFDCTYLLNERDIYVPNGSGDYSTVLINIDDVGSPEGSTPGLVIDKDAKMYKLECNADDSNFNKDKKLSNNSSNVVGVDYKGNKVDISVGSSEENEKTHYIRTGSTEAKLKFGLLKYNTVIFVNKSLVNGRYFTPNKIYMVKNYKDNKEYDGRYVLFKKSVSYQLQDGDFVPTVSLGLRMMVDFKSL